MQTFLWISRSKWGSTSSTEKYIQDQIADPASGKTEIHVHHTAAIDDDDSTPNRWDYEEAVAYMRRLEWIRPDLGPLPYSENYAVSEDLSVVWVFQGRGWLKRGAHTGGHNISGVGLSALGNFNKSDVSAAKAIISVMEQRVDNMRIGLSNLGNKKNPAGWNAFGHRDTKATSCPGSSLYPLLADFSLEGNVDEMVTRNDKADEGLNSLRANFEELKAAGVFTSATQPGGVTFNDEFATFLLRFEDHIVQKYDLLAENIVLSRGDTVELR